MQRNEKKAATVFDVAEKAGVSRGTVDRVIYGRGRVSEASRQRVMEAIAQLHYTPNANASSLASRKQHRFSVIIPEFKSGDYWSDIHRGFLDAARTFPGSNIDLRVHTYKILDADSFVHACEDVLEEKPDGVILNVIFPEEAVAFILSREQENIPYAFIDSKIDDLNYTLFYGIDSYKSGELGAALLTKHLDPKELLLVRVEFDLIHKVDTNRPRRHGFVDYMEDYHPSCRIHTVFIKPEESEENIRLLEAFFREHPDVHLMTMTNSRIFLLRDYLRTHPDPKRIVLGFDDLYANMECLREGLIDTLVTRHTATQSYKALQDFAACVIQRKRPTMRNNFVHMDILTPMNVDNYYNY